MGFVIFGAMGLYLLISIGVVAWAIRYARKNEKSAKRWGWGAVLVMYLIPFWDWIPTVAVHQYYCAKDSGFWVHKTLDHWKAENPGVIETLVANKGAPLERQGDMRNYIDTYLLNQRFKWVVKKNGPLPLNRWRWEQTILDTRTNEVLARYVDFSTGDGFLSGPQRLYKSWLQNNHCSGGERNDSQMRQFKINLRGTQE